MSVSEAVSPLKTQNKPYVMDNGSFRVEQYIAHDDPVFAGHYPHLPIYPGVLLLDMMSRAARFHLECQTRKSVELHEIIRVNFHHPVFPNTPVSIIGDCRNLADGKLDVQIRMESAQLIATARLRFRELTHVD